MEVEVLGEEIEEGDAGMVVVVVVAGAMEVVVVWGRPPEIVGGKM